MDAKLRLLFAYNFDRPPETAEVEMARRLDELAHALEGCWTRKTSADRSKLRRQSAEQLTGTEAAVSLLPQSRSRKQVHIVVLS